MEKPVIILGGGIWGCLLALRLKEKLPQVEFKIYEETSTLGNHESLSFRESDCKSAMPWLRPFISQSWMLQNIKGQNLDRWLTEPVHYIEAGKMHEILLQNVSAENIKLNNLMTPEFAIQEASFVIDTRNICHYSKFGFRKSLSLDVELVNDHHLIAPVSYDGTSSVKDHTRHLSYFPLGSNRLLIKDIWFSESRQMNLNEMRNELTESLGKRGWKISRVLREESSVTEVPLTSPVVREEGRVISLAGLFHDLTGANLPMAVELIDQMIITSFRFGELKEVVKKYRREKEIDRQFLRFLNRLLIEQKQHQVFDVIYKQPTPLIERFSRGNLKVIDRYKILAGKSNYEVGHLLKSIKLSNVFTLSRMPNSSTT